MVYYLMYLDMLFLPRDYSRQREEKSFFTMISIVI